MPDETKPGFYGAPERLAYFERMTYGPHNGEWALVVSNRLVGADVTRFAEWLSENIPDELRPKAFGGEIE